MIYNQLVKKTIEYHYLILGNCAFTIVFISLIYHDNVCCINGFMFIHVTSSNIEYISMNHYN